MASTNRLNPGILYAVEDLLTRNPCVRGSLILLAFIPAYYLAYKYAMTFSQASASPFWFPDSVLLCTLLVMDWRRWWLVIAVTLPIRLFSDVASDIPQWFLLACFANDSVKALLLAWALRAFLSNPLRLDSLRDLAIFCALAVLLMPALSALGGAAARAMRDPGQDFWMSWDQWFMGDALAQIVVTPFILYWVIGAPWRMPTPTLARSLEAGALAVGLVVTCTLACMVEDKSVSFTQARFYAPLPFMFWASIRFGMLGATGATAVVAFIATYFALMGHGPFSGLSPNETALGLQNFLLLRSVPFLFIAALPRDRKPPVAQPVVDDTEERFRQVADMTPVVLWMTDKTGSCRFVNTNCVAFTGRTFSEHLGAGWMTIVHTDDLRQNLGTWVEVYFAPRTFECELRMRRHDGVWRWMFSVLTPRYGSNKEFVGYVGTAVDITERKDAEELKRSVAHIQRLAAMGELTAAIAHEVKQPLTALRSNSDAAVHMLEAKVPNVKELRETIADISSDSRLAAEVLDRITRFLRKQERRVEQVDLNAAVRDVLRLIKHDADMRNVRIETYLDDDLARVRGDRTQLMQVLMNLIVNAMDAMATVPVDQRLLCVHTRDAGDCAEVEVKDCGSGIAQQNLPFVFDSFFTTKGGGMGLGLAVSRSIVEQHGGRIVAENNADIGASFHFTVPYAADASNQQPVQPPAQTPRSLTPSDWTTRAAESDEIPRLFPLPHHPPTADHHEPR